VRRSSIFGIAAVHRNVGPAERWVWHGARSAIARGKIRLKSRVWWPACECLALEVNRSLTADRLLDILTKLILTRGVPAHIRSDNGPEFIAQVIRVHRTWGAVGKRLRQIVLQ